MAEKSQPSATVKTDLGTVQGIAGVVRTFRGIPYGAPATGNLRWAPPQPAKPWTGVLDVTQWGADTFQPPPGPAGATRASHMSEDCLNLNIWTPAASADEKLPVLFWIPGGGFLTCYSSNPMQDGERLASKGAVVVSLNARTNVFGWLGHPQLSAESPHKVSGNYGLLDIMEALRWVKRNIGAFGGDPNRVTIFGVSSGGASAALLMVSPPAQGLFEQAILESPGAFRPLATLKDAEQAAVTNLGPDLAALRAIPAEEIAKKISLFVPKMRGLTTPRVLRPINDGSYVLPDDERELFYAGKYRAIPIIVGGVTDEGSSFIGGWPIKSVADFRGTIEQNFPEVLEQTLRLYPTNSDGEVPAQMAHVFGDCQFHYGAWGIAKANAARQPATYRFMLTRHRGGGAKAPAHGGEVSYVFGTLPLADGQRGAHDQTDVAISEAMMEYWVRFAATGNPNGGNLPHWPTYNPSSEEYLDFGDGGIAAQRRFRTEHMEFLDKLYSERVKARAR
jgi:para-nitrobenzyl esterase